jgi:hypothetical protein
MVLLAFLGAVHVFVFSALFPFFQITDEQAHFDLTVKYYEGQIPDRYGTFLSNSAPDCIIYSTQEYFRRDPTQKPAPPLWLAPPAVIQQIVAEASAVWMLSTNNESAQPPLYYYIAGRWWAGCQALGLAGGNCLYALRCLNGFLLIGTILISWWVTRLVFPENRFIRLAVPALIACQPQSIYYCISNDNLVPLTSGLLFLLLLKCWNKEVFSLAWGAALGFAFACVFLTKFTSLPLLVIVGAVLVIKVFLLTKRTSLRACLPGLLSLVICASVPILTWLIWCQTHFGDWSGAGQKARLLHWTLKPVAEWLHHPLFSLPGCAFFVGRNITTFWQGEAVWYRQYLTSPLVDAFYAGGTISGLVLLLICLVIRPKLFSSLQRQVLWFGLACLASLILFFAWLSVRYDFHDCFYPSSALPYFTSGRLLLGALIPAFLIFAQSLDLMLFKFSERAKFAMLSLLLLAMLVTEINIDRPVFNSIYNWFNM